MKQVLVAGVALLLAALSGSAQLIAEGQGVTARVNSNGSWSISVPERGWNFSGSVGTSVYALRNNQGTDNLGEFQELAFAYSAAGASRSASIRVYPSRPVVLFQVSCDSPSCNNTAPFPTISGYPALFHLSYTGEFAEPDFVHLAPDSPWVFFDGSANSYVVSAASNFMAASMSRDASQTIASGIAPQIAKLPAGFNHRTLLAFGAGINKTIEAWGDALTTLTGKQRPANDADLLLKSVSYWTDNGATYYYNPGGPSYADTLKSIKTEFAAKGIQLGSLQLDSWWYPKGPDNSWSSHSGIWTYTAPSTLFPSGLSGFRNDLGVPLVTHARWIDASSPYRSQYKISGNVATDPAYWEDIAQYLQSSGVTSYEQDWLGDNAHTDLNLTDPTAFLGNMAASMASRGLTIQYCMALPKHFLESAKYSNVTSIRSSQDRFGATRFTNFLYSSRFTTAVGAWPFSDVFMSDETHNLIAATLSAGPLGVGDPVGALAPHNLLKSVRPDGVIVKPDFAAVPLDSVYVNDAQKIDSPMIASASTDYGNGLRAIYLGTYPRGANNTWIARPADFGVTGPAYLYNVTAGTGSLIPAESSLNSEISGAFDLNVLVPVGPSGIAFLGDKGHYVTLGHKRITDLLDDGKVEATVAFAAGELSRVLTGYSPAPVNVTSVTGSHANSSWDPTTQLFTVKVKPSASGTAQVRISQRPVGEVCTARCELSQPVPTLHR